jgi:serine phosphatase RsbU (regulator of sigma subunit)
LNEFREEFLDIAIETEELAYETGDSNHIENSLFYLASAYGRNNKRELSIEVYERVSLLQLSRDDFHVSATYNNMATQFWHLNEMDSAIAYFEKGLEFAIKEDRPDGIAASKLRLGQTYGALGNFNMSLKLCTEAFEILQAEGIVRRQEQCSECIYLSYEELGNKEKAYDYLLLDKQLRDSLLSHGEQQELKLLSTQFHNELDNMRDSLDFAYSSELHKSEIEQQKKRSSMLWAGLGITLIFAIFILNRFRITRRQKQIIESQKHEVEHAHVELTEKNKEIMDSIVYAKRIQSAILPPDTEFKKHFPNSFILYKPKDIVAGDFYWLEHKDGKALFAAADCTGHGVPGAMVSVICNNGLNRSVREHGLTEPGKILDQTREIVIQEFEKSKEEVKDGMDIALCSLEVCSSESEVDVSRTHKLEYAGAHNPLWIIRKGSAEIEEIKANKQPIGKFDHSQPYTTHRIDLNLGDTLYIFSDGFADQFGGDKGKKFKASNFKELLLSHQSESMSHQRELIDEAFEMWKGNLEQLDDVCVIGVRV